MLCLKGQRGPRRHPEAFMKYLQILSSFALTGEVLPPVDTARKVGTEVPDVVLAAAMLSIKG